MKINWRFLSFGTTSRYINHIVCYRTAIKYIKLLFWKKTFEHVNLCFKIEMCIVFLLQSDSTLYYYVIDVFMLLLLTKNSSSKEMIYSGSTLREMGCRISSIRIYQKMWNNCYKIINFLGKYLFIMKGSGEKLKNPFSEIAS